MGDGDGWAVCGGGHRHWGRHGASGLLLYHLETSGEPHVLLQRRARWSIGGGTWGLLGGARHSHEDAVAGALREASEESTLDPSVVRVHGLIGEDHGGWAYDTVIGSVAERPDVRGASFETAGVAWVPVSQVAERKLFPPFADSWPTLCRALARPVIVVDAANVVGARADGWWRDRAGAAGRLRDDLAGMTSLTGADATPFEVAFPYVVMVVEGAARAIAAGGAPDRTEAEGGPQVVAAPGSGDDAIVDVVRDRAPDEHCLVVTADRELRARCEREGARVTGPSWLLSRLGR